MPAFAKLTLGGPPHLPLPQLLTQKPTSLPGGSSDLRRHRGLSGWRWTPLPCHASPPPLRGETSSLASCGSPSPLFPSATVLTSGVIQDPRPSGSLPPLPLTPRQQAHLYFNRTREAAAQSVRQRQGRRVVVLSGPLSCRCPTADGHAVQWDMSLTRTQSREQEGRGLRKGCGGTHCAIPGAHSPGGLILSLLLFCRWRCSL